jgi:hypothetical protein
MAMSFEKWSNHCKNKIDILGMGRSGDKEE